LLQHLLMKRAHLEKLLRGTAVQRVRELANDSLSSI
jgi:hypothetical protein